MNLASLPSTLLEGKTITLCVTGSISAYKAVELLRLYVKTGAKVKVVLSEGAKKFVTPLLFEALSSHAVLHEENESWSKGQDHIRYAQECDLLVIAPASANTLNKIACGFADTIVTQVFLATTASCIVAPAANTHMINAQVTRQSLEILKNRGVTCIGTQVKTLACQTTGDGALADVSEIFWQSARTLLRTNKYHNQHVVITAGGTIERIDDVRYLSNFSSGKMGRSLAVAAYLLGANVTLISSVGNFWMPHEITIKPFSSTKELYDHLESTLSSSPSALLFMAAAVSDFIPETTVKGKLKKKALGSSWDVHLVANTDVLSTLDKKGHFVVGFKAESDLLNGHTHAKEMLINKNLNAVCLNTISDEHSPFGSSTNALTLITHESEKKFVLQHKLPLSFEILNALCFT